MYLYNRFKGELTVNLAWTSLSGREFHEFGTVLYRLAQILQEKKNMPLNKVLANESKGWNESSFVLPMAKTDNGLCDGCRKAFAIYAVNEDHLCQFCKEDVFLGKELVKTRYIAYHLSKERRANKIQLLDDIYITVHASVETIPENGPYLVQKINDSDFSEVNIWPVHLRYFANYVPADNEGRTVSFDQIAKNAKGKPYLGYLKADMDNLGNIFVFGLMGEGRDNGNSISRITTLSRMLDLFFAGWIDQKLRQSYQNCYTVFSGGDDLFLVGPWSELANFTEELHREFGRYTGENPNVTLSAALVLSCPKTPVSKVAESVESVLESAKESVLPGQTKGRDHWAAFDAIFKLRHGGTLLKQAKQLAQWLEKGVVSTAFARNILTYSQMYQDYIRERISQKM